MIATIPDDEFGTDEDDARKVRLTDFLTGTGSRESDRVAPSAPTGEEA